MSYYFALWIWDPFLHFKVTVYADNTIILSERTTTLGDQVNFLNLDYPEILENHLKHFRPKTFYIVRDKNKVGFTEKIYIVNVLLFHRSHQENFMYTILFLLWMIKFIYELLIATFYTDGPGNYSICLSEQNVFSYHIFMKS